MSDDSPSPREYLVIPKEPAVPPIDVEELLTVHNKGECIEASIRRIYGELAKTVYPGFIVCEDGSKGNIRKRGPFSFTLHWPPGIYLRS